MDRLVLDGSNKYTVHTATSLGTSGVCELFSLLEIPKSIYEPEEKKWYLDHQLYKDYMMTVLLKWQEMNGQEATLEWLYDSLLQSGIVHIADVLAAMYNG